MVKVKDTLSFIEAARAVHGDRYDYSNTEWIGANSEIWIICQIHGRYRLAEAGTHYRKNKRPCGCRRCGDDSRMVSHQCECGQLITGSANWDYVKRQCIQCTSFEQSEWFVWAKKEFNHMCLIARKRAKRTDWDKWAENKRVSFCPSRARRKPTGRESKHVQYASWAEWSIARNGLVTRETDKWKIKAKNMADNLLRHARVERKQKTS